MKRTSSNRFFTGSTIARIVIALVLIIGVVVWRGALRDLLWKIVGPLYVHSPISMLAAQVSTKAALERENTELRATLASTTAVLADRELLFAENRELKLRFGRSIASRTILAGVIARPPTTPYDTLTIDAGSRQGVVVGALVSAGGTTRIGRVDSVGESTARVSLFSAPGESYQALIMETQSHSAIPVVVDGEGGGALTTRVPAHSGAGVGDEIVFSGINGGFSSRVVGVDQKSGESFEVLYLRLPVNPQELRFVEVELP